ncbi:hypothetical protein [Streptomyces sp. NPDC058385]|uniref:hypothetical protein n=1 Tax=Streptomyces sp. NPDC058385 TaxID=3346473 RepID=UPI00365F8921
MTQHHYPAERPASSSTSTSRSAASGRLCSPAACATPARHAGSVSSGPSAVFAATALNVIRIDRWLTGTPLGGSRTSHLENLILAA